MSDCLCSRCGCDPCTCENPIQPDLDNLNENTPVLELNTDPVDGCPTSDLVCDLAQTWETLADASLTVPATIDPPTTWTLGVCNNQLYQVGACVVIRGTNTDSSSYVTVWRVTEANADTPTILKVEQYDNEFANLGATLSGTLTIAPLNLCPAEDSGCMDWFAYTTDDFNMPAVASGSATVELDRCNDLEIGDEICIQGAGRLQITDVQQNGRLLEVENDGAHCDNTFAGATIAAGAKVFPPGCSDCGGGGGADDTEIWASYSIWLNDTIVTVIAADVDQFADAYYIEIPMSAGDVWIIEAIASFQSPRLVHYINTTAATTGVTFMSQHTQVLDDGVDDHNPSPGLGEVGRTQYFEGANRAIVQCNTGGTKRFTIAVRGYGSLNASGALQALFLHARRITSVNGGA